MSEMGHFKLDLQKLWRKTAGPGRQGRVQLAKGVFANASPGVYMCLPPLPKGLLVLLPHASV